MKLAPVARTDRIILNVKSIGSKYVPFPYSLRGDRGINSWRLEERNWGPQRWSLAGSFQRPKMSMAFMTSLFLLINFFLFFSYISFVLIDL